MAECSEISLMLGPFDDGELEPHEMQEVARHLARCKDCEKLLEDYSAIGRELRSFASQSTLPPMEEFALAVDARIKKLRLPWRERVALAFDGWSEQVGTALASMAMAATAAILTIFLMTPLTRVYFNRQAPATSLARVETRVGEQRQQLASAESPASVSTPGNSEAIISRLESNIPSVALWSAPQDGTTVIWLPEQPQQ